MALNNPWHKNQIQEENLSKLGIEPVLMEETPKLEIKNPAQAARALTFLKAQLLEALNLVEDCGNSLQNRPDSTGNFLDLENKLEKVLYETRALSRPPPVTPAKTDFEIIKPISSGAFGTVKLVRYKATRKIFAMKQIKLNHKEQREEVKMERDILASLDCPLVVSMFCSFETTNHLYMAMDFAGGGDCFSLLQDKHRFSEKLSRFFIAEIVLAVEYIHSYGIIHRDLKPSNLLISTTGHIKMADFGLCKTGSVNIPNCLTLEDCQNVAREFTDEECCGTPLFMPPEVFKRTGYGKPVDWWAVGVILYNFLIGKLPFTWDYYPTYDPIQWPKKTCPSNDAQDLISLLLTKDCVRRLGTRGAKEVKQHPFFMGVNWSSLPFETSPYIPKLQNEEDTSGFIMCSPLVSEAASNQMESTPVQSDFCCVAFNFKKVPIPMPLSPYVPKKPESRPFFKGDYLRAREEQNIEVSDLGCLDAMLDDLHSSEESQAASSHLEPVFQYIHLEDMGPLFKREYLRAREEQNIEVSDLGCLDAILADLLLSEESRAASSHQASPVDCDEYAESFFQDIYIQDIRSLFEEDYPRALEEQNIEASDLGYLDAILADLLLSEESRAASSHQASPVDCDEYAESFFQDIYIQDIRSLFEEDYPRALEEQNIEASDLGYLDAILADLLLSEESRAASSHQASPVDCDEYAESFFQDIYIEDIRSLFEEDYPRALEEQNIEASDLGYLDAILADLLLSEESRATPPHQASPVDCDEYAESFFQHIYIEDIGPLFEEDYPRALEEQSIEASDLGYLDAILDDLLLSEESRTAPSHQASSVDCGEFYVPVSEGEYYPRALEEQSIEASDLGYLDAILDDLLLSEESRTAPSHQASSVDCGEFYVPVSEGEYTESFFQHIYTEDIGPLFEEDYPRALEEQSIEASDLGYLDAILDDLLLSEESRAAPPHQASPVDCDEYAESFFQHIYIEDIGPLFEEDYPRALEEQNIEVFDLGCLDAILDDLMQNLHEDFLPETPDMISPTIDVGSSEDIDNPIVEEHSSEGDESFVTAESAEDSNEDGDDLIVEEHSSEGDESFVTAESAEDSNEDGDALIAEEHSSERDESFVTAESAEDGKRPLVDDSNEDGNALIVQEHSSKRDESFVTAESVEDGKGPLVEDSNEDGNDLIVQEHSSKRDESFVTAESVEDGKRPLVEDSNEDGNDLIVQDHSSKRDESFVTAESVEDGKRPLVEDSNEDGNDLIVQDHSSERDESFVTAESVEDGKGPLVEDSNEDADALIVQEHSSERDESFVTAESVEDGKGPLVEDSNEDGNDLIVQEHSSERDESFVTAESVEDGNGPLVEDLSEEIDDCAEDVFTGVDDTTSTLNPLFVLKSVMNTMNPVMMMNPVRRAMHPLLAINQLRLNLFGRFFSSAEPSHP